MIIEITDGYLECMKCEKVVKCPDCVDLDDDNTNTSSEKWDNYYRDIGKGL